MPATLLAAVALTIGAPAPPLSVQHLLQSPEGASVSWPALKGTAVVLDFWATWCAPCVEGIPHWNALVEKFKDRPVRFIAVSSEDPEVVAPFLEKRPMSGWIALDPPGTAFESYGIESVPRTFLVDANGIVRAITSPLHLTESDIEQLLAGRELKLPERAVPG